MTIDEDDTHDHRVSEEEIKFRLRRCAADLGLTVLMLRVQDDRDPIERRFLTLVAEMPEEEKGRR